MKKSLLIKISTLALSVCSLLCIGTACKEEHTHSYTETITAPTCTAQGFTTHTCSCGDSYVDCYIDELGHNFIDYNFNGDATCTENGTETATCSRDGCTETDTRTKENSALNHDYGMVTYTWNENQCTAERTCSHDSAHKENETITAEYVKDTDVTCTTAETGHYIATFVNSAFTTQTTNKDTVVKGEPLNHNYGTPVYVWNGDECTATRICDRDHTHQETETVTAVYVKDTDVTCDTPETGHYKATFNNNAFVMQETEENSFIKGEALDHSFDEPTYTWVNDKCIAKRICSRDNSHVETETITATYVKDTNATCTTPEKGHYIAMFENSAFTKQQTTENSFVNGEALGHDWDDGETIKEATCIEVGTTLYSCGRCNETKAEDIAKKSHETSSKIIEPTCDAPGYTLTYCKNCSYSDWSNFKKSKEHSGSGSCSYCGSDYVSMLGDWLIENGSYSTDSSGVRYGINEWLTSSVKGMVYYYPSTNKIVWWAQTYSNGSLTSSLNLNMPSANGSYSWTFMVFLSSYILEMDGTITASNIHSGTSSLSYSSVYAMPSTTIPYDIKLDMSQTAASALKLIIQEIGVIAGACEENITVKDLGFTNFSSHEHTWAQVGTYTKSTCTTSGSVKYKCASCDVTKTEIISAHGHIYAPQVKTQEETCTQIGIIEEKCYFCSYVRKTEIDKLDHNYNDVITAPTCLEDGYTTHTCPDCDDVLIDTYVNALGHKTTEHFTFKKQSCTETGVERYTCINSNCNYYEDETIPMDDHDYEEIVGAAGYITEKCNDCGKTIATPISYTIGYNLDGGTATNNPTYTIETGMFTLINPTKKGYEFTGWTGTDLSGKTMTVTIAKGTIGSRSYTANWTANTYTLTYDVNGGDALADSTQSVTYDANYSVITPTRTGYSFVKWATSDGVVYNGGKWQTDSDVTVIAEWKANTDTKYTVRHHQQNINDDGYTVFETDNLKGESDSSITPDVNTYTGFTSPKSTTTTILPDGNRVVDYYYTRNYYTVSFVVNGGEAIETIKQKYQSTLTIPNGERAGFTFGGWFIDIQLSSSYTDTIMPATNKTVYAWWSEENKPTDFTYSGTANITINGYKGTNGIVRIPSFIGNIAVNSIVDSAFENNSFIQQITFSDNITSIGNYALKNCVNLEKITVVSDNQNYCTINGDLYSFDGTTLIQYAVGKSDNIFETSNTVSSIDAYAFYGSENLKEVVITNNQTILAKNSFTGCCGLESLTLSFYDANTYLGYIFGASSYSYNASYVPQSLRNVMIKGTTKITNSMLSNCSSLKNIIITEDTITIGSGAFSGCSGLESITLPFVGEKIDATNEKRLFGYIFGTNTYDGSTVTKQHYSGTSGEIYYKKYYIPNKLNIATITGGKILYGTFWGCENLTQINIQSEINEISDYAFYGCKKLEEVNLPNTLTKIGNSAFSSCSALEKIVGIENVESIGKSAFNACKSLTKLVIPENVTSIGEYAFYGCTIVNEIDFNAINCSDLTSKNYAFYNVGIDNTTGTKIVIGNQVVSLPKNLFNPYGYYESSFADNIISVEFEEDSICEVIPTYAFAFFNKLQEINLPDSIEKIGSSAFEGCTSLTNINIPTKVTALPGNMLSGCVSLANIVIPENITSIGYQAFLGCTSITNIVVPNSVKTISSGAFSGCSNLESITLPFVGGSKTAKTASKETLFGYVFGADSYDGSTETKQHYSGTINESSYAKYYIPNKLKVVTITDGGILYGAFCGCANLTQINIQSKINEISDYAFYGCKKLEEVNLPDTLTKIGNSAFSSCSALEKIVGIENVESIGKSAFNACKSLTELVIPENVTTIQAYTFSYCTSLKSIIISANITTINDYAFQSCTSLVVYCEATSKPSGWKSNWNYSKCPVYWYSENQPEIEGNYWRYVDGIPNKWSLGEQ